MINDNNMNPAGATMKVIVFLCLLPLCYLSFQTIISQPEISNESFLNNLYADEIILLDAPPGKLPNYLLNSPVISPFMPKSTVIAPSGTSNDNLAEPPATGNNKTKPGIAESTPKTLDSKSVPTPKDNPDSKESNSEKQSPEEKQNPPEIISNKRNRGHQCIPPKDYPVGDIPLEILDYNKLTLPAICSKGDPETPDDLLELEKHVKSISKQVIDATVCVRAGGGSGSGVVISEDGWILTAAHVCIKPGQIFTIIFSDGKKVKAVTYGTNHEDDAGLMKITDAGKWPHVGVAAVPIEESAWTLCTGHPGGLQDNRPPVLRLGRVIRSCQHVVRTDNLIMPGDSGGPVFDMYGRVVAINSRIGPSQSLNYHVPAWVFLRDWDRLEKKESWGSTEVAADNRGFLGVELERGADEAKIKTIMPGLPAEKAELKTGDVILDVNGKEVRSFEDLVGYLSRKKAGDKVTLKIKRGSEEFTKEITLAESPKE